MSPKISVIIPIYNAAKYLDECLNSVIAQSFEDYEVILLPGECTDNSAEICENWAGKDNRIRIVSQDINCVGYARNKGVLNAKGEYVCFCDADDVYKEDYLKKMYAAAEESDADIVECCFEQVDENLTGAIKYSSMGALEFCGHFMYERFAAPSIWKCMFKKEIWDNNQIHFPEKNYGEDLAIYSLLFSVCKSQNFIYEPLYLYRRVGTSLSNNSATSWNSAERYLDILEWIATEFKRLKLFYDRKLDLCSQAERHGMALAARDKGEEGKVTREIDFGIRRIFEVNKTIFDIVSFGWGSKHIGQLCKDITQKHMAQAKYIMNMSFAELNDECLCNEMTGLMNTIKPDIVLVDMANEFPAIKQNKSILKEFLYKWTLGCKRFVSICMDSKPELGIVLIPLATASNIEVFEYEVVKMLEETFLQNGGVKKIEDASMADIREDNTWYDTFLYEKLVDLIHGKK